MRLHPAVGLTVAALTAVLGLPVPAAAADVTTLYVRTGPGCSDGGVGTSAVPYCTIGAAAAVVEPGQTVLIAAGRYAEQLNISRSGTPGHPITFLGDYPSRPGNLPQVVVGTSVPGATIAVNGVHDVVLGGMRLRPNQGGVAVTDSSAITVDRMFVSGPENAPITTPAVALSGATSDVTISRNSFVCTGGVAVGAGVRRALVTTNEIDGSAEAAIRVTDAPGTAVTHNTLSGNRGPGIVLAGDSGDAVVKNNVLTSNGADAAWSGLELSASEASTRGTGADYNSVHQSGQAAYEWAGTRHTLAAFPAATGQGVHDTDVTVAFPGTHSTYSPLYEGSPAIDSADPSAPGALGTDLLGRPAVDDPKAANTGPQGGVRDRGAYEFQGIWSVRVRPDLDQGPYPLTVDTTVDTDDSWGTTLTYTYDFGDGTPQVVSTDPRVAHTFTAKGDYSFLVTVTDALGRRLTSIPASEGGDGARISVRDPGPLLPALTVAAPGPNPQRGFDATGSTSPWKVTKYTLDPGDGTPAVSQDHGSFDHVYTAAGTYTATLTVTDQAGRTASTTAAVTTGYTPAGFVPVAPHRLLDTREPMMGRPWPLGPGESRVIGMNAPAGATAGVINVTATNAGTDTHIDVRPWQGKPTGTSNLNVGPGQTVANLVTVPLDSNGGYFEVSNNAGAVDVIIDFFGYYKPDAADRFTPLTPVRLLDTRQGAGAKVGPASSVSLQVTGAGGVPAGAHAVVLNVTATEPTDTGYLAVRPSGQDGRPSTSNLNFRPGQTVPNQVIVPLGPDGAVTVFNNSGATHVIADVAGYYSSDGRGLFTPVAPVRLQDTRTAGGPVPAYGSRSVQVGGAAGVPADVVAGVFNLTVTGAGADGHVIGHPDGSAVPGTSSVNFTAGGTASDHAQLPLGANGRLDLVNRSAGGVQLITDLFGYFTNA
ncbi:PKD domain-containing protein [Kitasatospora sp. NBC_00240]|uniref:PKD domain-containing protein n=1 Tax=Kitasatospora sp. NBC_00240 TaxID=2903567 RepID=UPI00224D638B|nr:PKD domain-containing protein [Kitasatospora sp. NBC_00240]MCX5211217.1 PKD domain-containing protein [Kitasatospora sp. NBC_00240]